MLFFQNNFVNSTLSNAAITMTMNLSEAFNHHHMGIQITLTTNNAGHHSNARLTIQSIGEEQGLILS